MATQINNYQLAKLVDANKVLGGAIDITGSADTMGSGLADGDFFLVQDASSGVPQKITAAVMQDYFSNVDILETSTDAAFQIVFADDDTAGGGDGKLRVDGAHLTYNPSSNLLTVGGDISVGDDLLLASDGAVLSLGVGADVTLTHDGGTGAAIASAGAFDIDAGGALTLDGSSITIGGDSDVAVDFDASTFDLDASDAVTIDSTSTIVISGDGGATLSDDTEGLAYDGSGNVDFDAVALDIDASGAITVDGTSTLSLDAADDTNLSMAANSSSEKKITIAASNSGSGAGVVDVDADGAITVDAGAGLSLQGGAASDLTTGAGALTLDGAGGVSIAGNSSEVDITTSGAFDVNVGSVDLDSTAGIAIDGTTLSLDGTDDTNLTMTGNSSSAKTMTIAASNSGSGAGVIDMDADGAITVDAGAGLSLQGGAASDLSTSAGDLTVDAAAGSLNLTGGEADAAAVRVQADNAAGGIDIDAGTGGIAVDTTGGLSMDAADSSNLSMAANSSSDKTLTIAASNSGSGAGNMAISADTVTITGNLDVNGTTTTIDTVNVAISDHNIVIDRDNSTSAVIDGAGITMEGGSGDDITIQQHASGDRIEMKKGSGYHTLAVGKLSFDGTSGDYLELDTDVKVFATADILLDPAGGEVQVDGNLIPGSDGDDALGRPVGSASVSGTSMSNLHTAAGGAGAGSQSITMSAGAGQVILLAGSSQMSNPSGTSNVSAISSSNLSAISSMSSSTTNVSISGSPSVSFSVGDLIAFVDSSSNKIFYVVTDAYSPGDSTLFIKHLDNLVNGSLSGSPTALHTVGAFSTNFPGSESGMSNGTEFSLLGSDSSNFATFQLLHAYSDGDIALVVDPLAAKSSLSTWTSSAATSSGLKSITFNAAPARFAWSNVYADNVTLAGSGRIDLDADDDTSIRSSGDDQIDFEIGGSDLISMKAAGLQIVDDKKLMFGSASGGDASFEYDEDGTDTLLYDGASLRINDDTKLEFGAGGDASFEYDEDGNDVLLYAGASLRISDDVKIEFGSGGDAGIEYDEDGTDQLRIHQPAAGVVIAGTNPKLVIGDAGAEDTMLVFDGNAQDFRVGLDDGTDVLEIGVGAAHGTTTSLKLDSSLNVDVAGHNGMSVGLQLGGTLVSSTAAELNIMDGNTSATSTTVATGDRVVYNDAGTMKQVTVDNLGTYFGSGDGVQASSAGALSIDYVEDLFMKVGSGTLLTNGISASLSQEPLADSLHVYLNGLLMLKSGSITGNTSFDYRVDGSGASQKVVFPTDKVTLDNDDVVTLKYIKK